MITSINSKINFLVVRSDANRSHPGFLQAFFFDDWNLKSVIEISWPLGVFLIFVKLMSSKFILKLSMPKDELVLFKFFGKPLDGDL